MIQRFQRALVRRVAAWAAAAAVGLSAGVAAAAESGFPLDPFPVSKLSELPSLQNGARLFVNYCLNCHSAKLMRYNRLRDIGLTEQQIRDNLMFTAEKVGDPMNAVMPVKDAKEWFGAAPPDLSVIARARSSHAGTGADWLYTYLRAYYRDATRATGWNNAVFPNVGMPHVLWELQGSRGAVLEEVRAVRDDKTGQVAGFTRTTVTFDADGRRTERSEKLQGTNLHESATIRLSQPVGGKLSRAEYDEQVADLVAYIAYMSDPSQRDRLRLGVWVLIFLAIFTFLAWWTNREYWKDVR